MPGFARASSTSSATDLAFVRGPTTSTFGIMPTSATGASSRRGSTLARLYIDCAMATCGVAESSV